MGSMMGPSAAARPARAITGSSRHAVLKVLGILAGATLLLASSALLGLGAGFSLHAAVATRALSGTYALNTIGGQPVPATAVDTTAVDPWGRGRTRLTIVLTGATVTLSSPDRYQVDATYLVKLNGSVVSTQKYGEAGTYVADPTGITFMSALTGLVARGTITDGSLSATPELLGTDALKLRCLAGNCMANSQ